MSRSYKKTLGAGDHPAKGMKRLASKAVRSKLKNTDYVLRGKSYKKLFNSWDIKDYWFRYNSFDEFYNQQIQNWFDYRYQWDEFPEEDELRIWFYKHYKRK